MKRPGPEERDEVPPLFAHAEKLAAANRAEVGMTRAADRATRIYFGWRAEALEAVRQHATAHTHFLCEDVKYVLPENCDGRAWGAVMRDAVRAGLVVADGWAPANSSNRSAKVRWRSLIVRVTGTSPATASTRDVTPEQYRAELHEWCKSWRAEREAVRQPK